MNDTTRWPMVMLIALTCVACADNDTTTPNLGTSSDAITWYGDVAHVAQNKCQTCHNDDAPTFSMARFSEELAARAPLMAAYVDDGTMPPWKPSADCNSFADERRLTDDEKAVFQAWAEDGALEGDPADAPPAPDVAPGLARVDRRLDMEDAYLPEPPAGEINDFRCFVLDPKITAPEQLVGFDIVPGEKAVVHHVLLYIADPDEVAPLDAADAGPGYNCPGGPIATSAKVIAGWVPGMPANNYPAGTGIPLSTGDVLVMQIHYNTGQAGPLPDQTAVELMLADTPMEFPAQITSLKNSTFVIPPQSSSFTASANIDVPGKSTIWALAPHMHLKGRRTVVEVERANGETSCLLDIPDWDFNWQQFYFFDSPTGVALEPGDRVKLSCTWENASDDEVRWGDGTEDEMCITFAFITPGHVN